MSLDLPNRKYPRADWINYNDGLFFVTVNTREHKIVFGHIVNDEMILSHAGKILNECINSISEHYTFAEIDSFVIMPNHFHLIIQLCPKGNSSKDNNIGALHAPRHPLANDGFEFINHHNTLLATVIGGIKSSTSRIVRQNGMQCIWQPRYHEHWIRNGTRTSIFATT